MRCLVSATTRTTAQTACLVLLAQFLTACATYSPLPLAVDAEPKATVDDLRHSEPLPARLAVDDVARLAVENNPDLLAAHTRLGVGRAELLQAGVLPNPTLGGSYGFLLGGPATSNPIVVALSQDVRSLVTRASRRCAAHESLAAFDAALLWEEWQVVAKARLMTVASIEGERQVQGLAQTVAVLASRIVRVREALTVGDATMTNLIADLVAFTDLRRQLDELERRRKTQHEELAVLLGLAPQATLDLADSLAVSALDPAPILENLRDIVVHRPDLLALQFGYLAQEERLRGAILAQFPLLTIGGGFERDNTDVRTATPQIAIELPVFDRNQGSIAGERATRQQLHDEFTARLVAAHDEVLALLADQALLRTQYDGKREQLALVDSAADHADVAFAHGDLDERSYVDALVARATKRQELLSMEQTLLEQQVAMAALLGSGMPRASFVGEEPK
jgi:outer membrane protein TolC